MLVKNRLRQSEDPSTDVILLKMYGVWIDNPVIFPGFGDSVVWVELCVYWSGVTGGGDGVERAVMTVL